MKENLCPLCGGKKTEGNTTFVADLKETVVVVREVPATLCSLCGQEWIADDIAEQLEQIATEAKKKQHQFEVTKFPKSA